MKKSPFLLEVPIDGCRLLIINILSNKSFIVETNKWQLIEDRMSRSDDRAQSAIGSEVLADSFFFVLNPDEEIAKCVRSFNAFSNQKLYSPVIVATTSCNLRCLYCYENGINDISLDKFDCANLACYIEEKLKHGAYVKCIPVLYGGEPLLNKGKLFSLMDSIIQVCERRNVDINFACNSNGTLLTEDYANELLAHRLSSIQISIDGSENFHNIRRPLKGGLGSFDSSMAGIRVAAKKFETTLKVTFDMDTPRYYRELLDYLARDQSSSNIAISIKPVSRILGKSNSLYNWMRSFEPNDIELAETYYEMIRITKDYGYSISDVPQITPCIATANYSEIINADGRLYKCASLIGREEYSIGSITSGISVEKLNKYTEILPRISMCIKKKCCFLPACMGGCLYEGVIRGKAVEERYCSYDFYKEYFRKVHFRNHAL